MRQQVGEGLAQVTAATVYGLMGASASCPTLAWCVHFTHAGGASNLARRFISTLLCAGDAVAVGNCGPQPVGAAAATMSSSM